MVVHFGKKHWYWQRFEAKLPSLLLVVVVVFIAIVGGCAENSPDSSFQPAAKTAPDTVIDPATAGSISGTVYLEGPPPVFPAINMQSEPGCVKANAPDASAPYVLVGTNGALANVVVYVDDGLNHYRFRPPRTPVVLDQKGCMYAPRIVALMTNQTLEIHNSDATIHNVHAMPKINREWNKAERSGGVALQTSFPRPELAIPFMCNVHPWMRAFVFVFDHPYFSVTSSDGRFALKNLPPGSYTVEAWQEKLGTQSQVVAIGPRESREVSFRFRSPLKGH
jgi:plastocyanin